MLRLGPMAVESNRFHTDPKRLRVRGKKHAEGGHISLKRYMILADYANTTDPSVEDIEGGAVGGPTVA